MKSNIVTRLIIDSENNKAYLSVEGKVEKATEEEKIELRNKLFDAFSNIFGINANSSSAKPEILKDFVSTSEEPPKFEQSQSPVKESEKTSPAKIEEVTSVANETTPGLSKDELWSGLMKEFAGKGKHVIGFTTEYGKNTVYEALAKDGEKAIKVIEKAIIPGYKRGLKSHPNNHEKIAEAEAAIAEFKQIKETFDTGESDGVAIQESLFDKMVNEIKEISVGNDDPEFDAVNVLCKSIGTTFADILAKNDEKTLQTVHTMFIKMLEESKKIS